MSKKKPVDIHGQFVWVYDNAHDIVLAHLVEVAEQDGRVSDDQIERWRVLASVPDIGLRYPIEDDVSTEVLSELLGIARKRVVEAGDVTREDVADWSVLDGMNVSDGFLRTPVLAAPIVVEVVDAFASMVAGTFRTDPDEVMPILGSPGSNDSK